jgi:hypothetical protein
VQPIIGRGATRVVLVVGHVAFKFDRGDTGVRCNRFEAHLYSRVVSWRKAMLCPVIACSPNGAVLLAKAATPLTQSEFDELRKAGELPDWDYHPLDGDGECPFEYKWCDDRVIENAAMTTAVARAEASHGDELLYACSIHGIDQDARGC